MNSVRSVFSTPSRISFWTVSMRNMRMMTSMANFSGRPTRVGNCRRIRAPREWKVETVSARIDFPTTLAIRSRISAAARFVKVTARIRRGSTPRSSRWTIR